MNNECKNIVKNKSYQFALKIVELYKTRINNKNNVLFKQFLRSSTSIGANVAESEGAISQADFSSKISIAYKESLESKYWLNLLCDSGYIEKTKYDELFADADEISRLLYSILKKQGSINNYNNCSLLIVN